MKKSVLFFVLILLLAGAGFAYLQYNKGHRNTQDEAPAHTLQASALFRAYEADEAAANALYLDKLLLVSGTVSGISQAGDSVTTVMLQTEDPMFGVSCQLLAEEATQLAGLQEGVPVNIKGICTGKLMDVVLVRCVLVP